MPPCSPLIIINKLIESNSFTSDLHPYYPVPPCPYEGPLEALEAGDVDLVVGPQNIPRHLLYELSWLLATGLPRKLGLLTGREKLLVQPRILSEGYSHHTRTARTRQLGHNSRRNPRLYQQQHQFDSRVSNNWQSFLRLLGVVSK